ncbi:kinase-like protein [Polyplosphaeria fusca]|uniref:non-specific serine/threonine protein kinase n=1 Tax=Polyplosphaeria fusca TaxID=682080 RepID=A0A9P4R8F1_9PLEO|nr:kinase-like protein [Polyplosphaeria fusca]
MSSARYAHPAASSIPQQQAAYRAPAATSSAPPGTFQPGTKIQVGSQRVQIERYLSEGGFAHVYVVRVPKTDERIPEVAVLKRVAVPDKDALANMRTEVETMKKLKGHKHVVTYFDSHASQLKGGGYEVFLLMEYCQGGGLIDFMNTRLQHRLTEPEILHIFSDVAEGVATMHYLKPPLLHRDLKVENVLISTSGSSRIYKLCDFGSSASPRPAATTAAEGRLIEDDVQRHTTLQYRSPEMIDVYRKQPIDEKSDIWALGVLLYKLCYYTTPFEEVGQMAILNATFKYPSYPVFSDRLKKLIAWTLRENPQDRPNIYQVIVEVCSMRHRSVPIKDIYSNRTPSEDRRNQQLPPSEANVQSPPVIGLQKVAPVQKVQHIPDITPMRRGRPTAPTQAPSVAKPSPSPMRGSSNDPFAALDSQNVQVRSAAADELAARFPSLDEFSLLHDRGQKFEFGAAPSTDSNPAQDPLNRRVAHALADDAFAFPAVTKAESAPTTKPSSTVPSAGISRSTSVKKPTQYESSKESGRTPRAPVIQEPTPQRPSMVSTGIQTSPSPSPAPQKYPDGSTRPVIWRVPETSQHHHRALSQPRTFEQPHPSPSTLRPDYTLPTRPSLEASRSKSQMSTLGVPKSPASSRPSLETSRPSAYDLGSTLDRSKSANSRPRPTSVHVESNLDFLRDRELAPGRNFDAPSLAKGPPSAAMQDSDSETDEKNISSNVDFLRAMDDDKQKKHRRSSSQSKHNKRSSLSSITSNTKNIVKGRFGDAFRMFENNNHAEKREPEPPLTPTGHLLDRAGKSLTPIAGSEATGGTSDDERVIDETEDLSPQMRRELERRRLEQEEKRVADAAAEYKQRLAAQGDRGKGQAGSTRASTIQNRVKSLLDDSQKPVAATRTAEGYGHYTDTGKPLPTRPAEQSGVRNLPPPVSRKPLPKPLPSNETPVRTSSDLNYAKQRLVSQAPTSASAPPAAVRTVTGPQTRGPPSAPPKPRNLRTGGTNDFNVSKQSPMVRDKPLPIPGDVADEDFDVASFSKRYPSLSGLEMVETEIPNSRSKGGVREI